MSVKDKNYLQQLIKKLQSGDISDDEIKFLSNFFSNQNKNKEWPFDDALKNELKNKIFNSVTSKVNEESQKNIKLTSFYKNNALKYAATALVLISIAFVWKYNSSEYEGADVKISTNKIKVGTDKATLTLEDGQYVDLEKGQVYATKNVKSTGDKLFYNNRINLKPKLVYNYLTVPRGGQFFLQLSDGTKVWLNSESKLKYPVNFIEGENREVELVYGEAFFDVSPSSRHNGALFRVASRMQTVEVLGTKFNIKSYKDENMVYTTLVEGKVKVSNQSENVYLKPNQQSQVSLLNKNIILKDIDVYNATSWVKGVFSFEGKPLKDIMKVLSRWYDMDVVFANDKIQNIKFIGVLSKNQNIEDVLISIKESGFINAYAIKNKQIILK